MSPKLGLIDPVIRFIIDDFPAPLGPSNPITCPFEISRDILSRIKWFFLNDESTKAHSLPEEAGFYFMVYNLKTPSS